MTGKSLIASSIILGASLITGAYILVQPSIDKALKTVVNKERTVEVKGVSERIVQSNRAVMNLTYNTCGVNPNEVRKKSKQQAEIIKAFLVDLGLANDEYAPDLPSSINDKAEYNREFSDFSCRYETNNSFIIDTTNISNIQKIFNNCQKLIDQGVDLNIGKYSVTFYFNKLNELKPVMVEEATKNAREVADKFAADSGAKIGGIKNARQGQFTIEDSALSGLGMKQVRVVSTLTFYIE